MKKICIKCQGKGYKITGYKECKACNGTGYTSSADVKKHFKGISNHSRQRFDLEEGPWQSGKAAYGGTYITATSLSSVNHSFQTTGEHTVYYRCMDDMGIWSMWYSKKINVE